MFTSKQFFETSRYEEKLFCLQSLMNFPTSNV